MIGTSTALGYLEREGSIPCAESILSDTQIHIDTQTPGEGSIPFAESILSLYIYYHILTYTHIHIHKDIITKKMWAQTMRAWLLASAGECKILHLKEAHCLRGWGVSVCGHGCQRLLVRE